MNNRHVMYALVAALLVVVGMLAGFRLKQTMPEEKKKSISDNLQKFQEAFWFVERHYIDETKAEKMVDDAISGMLEGLDPHSFYISAEEAKAMEEDMQGSFQGIGIEFNIVNDTIYVVAALSGGPSQKLGIQSGDRIVKIEGETVAGIGIENKDVTKKLRGPKGSVVKVEIRRNGAPQLLKFDITRDDIPLFSVDYSYMVRPEMGYIKLSKFSETTYQEFDEHLNKLKSKGMKSLVLDLRGNPGGYMEMAERVADEFIKDGRLIVYTKGRTEASIQKYNATPYIKGFEKGALVILMDYGSASASEIVAGAVQDWDRGLIIGVRSFGKGLVQTQNDFEDGSAMRLVISQYFTPSKRCIQKPYKMSTEEYDNELLRRMESGEFYDPAKMQIADSLKFYTNSKRVVYGGGGIIPDVFVAPDTSQSSDYLRDLIGAGCFNEFAFAFADKNPEMKKQYSDAAAYCNNFSVSESLIKDFIAFGESKKVPFNGQDFRTSEMLIRNYVKSFIGRRVYGEDAFWPVYLEADNQLLRALELMPQAEELESTGKFNLK